MTTNDYLTIRKTAIELVSKILDLNKDRNNYIYAGKLLGFWDGEGEVMVFDKDEESDILMEFVIYEKTSEDSGSSTGFTKVR